jgi:uncharacterized protein
MQQRHKPLNLQRKIALKFEKDLFNGYRIHAYDSKIITLATPILNPAEDNSNTSDHFYNASNSFIVSTNTLIKDWPLDEVQYLASDHLQTILDLEPELVLLGTGQKQHFPEMKLFAQFYNQGIGVEIMDSAAACRTFNILAGEGRKVVAGIMIDKIMEQSSPD